METSPLPADGIRRFLELVVHGLIGEKAPCRVDHRVASGQDFFALQVPESERALLIGHSGNTITAMRNLAAAAGALHGLRVCVDVPDE